jgi:urease accessory protein
MEQHMKKIIGSLLAIAAMATTAEAHVGPVGHVHGFLNGFVHPLTGIDHILAMVAVGAFAVVLGGRALWALPLTFMTVMLAGGILGMTGFALPAVETGIAASVLVLGTVVALQWKAPLRVATVLVGFFAVFHGFAHGAEMPVDVSGSSFGAGFLAATALLHAVGVAIAFAATSIRYTATLRLVKVAGAVSAVTGLGMLGGWL